MIDFSWSESDSLIKDTLDRFAADCLTPQIRDSEKARCTSDSVRLEWEKLGLVGLEVPEVHGGGGCTSFTRCLVNESLGAADPGAALDLDRIGAALYPILEMGNESDYQNLILPLMEDPQKKAILVYAPDCDLKIDGEECSGRIPWIHRNQVETIVCLDDHKAWLIESKFTLAPIRGSGLRAAGGSSVTLNKSPIRKIWESEKGARRALARARLYYGSLLLGVLNQCTLYSRDYAKERMVFGKPVAHHQAMAFLLTDMNSAVSACRLLLHQAAACNTTDISTEISQKKTHQEVDDFCEAAATAFAETCEASTFIGPNGVQILGGVGFMQDYPVEKYMREARALSLMLGGVDDARDTSIEALLSEPSSIELIRGIL